MPVGTIMSCVFQGPQVLDIFLDNSCNSWLPKSRFFWHQRLFCYWWSCFHTFITRSESSREGEAFALAYRSALLTRQCSGPPGCIIVGGWRGATLLFLLLIWVFSYSNKTCSSTQTIWYSKIYLESWCMQEDMQKRFSVYSIRSLHFVVVAPQGHWSILCSEVKWSKTHFMIILVAIWRICYRKKGEVENELGSHWVVQRRDHGNLHQDGGSENGKFRIHFEIKMEKSSISRCGFIGKKESS